jgi:phosphatidylglycerophosphatase A
MRDLSVPVYAGLVALLFVFGVWICNITTRALGVEDHPGIVFDEMVGYWVTMIAVPATPVSVVAGFVLFRVMDIWKPWPIRWVDRKVSGGLGIMMDDVLAGFYACLLLQLLLTFLGAG